MRKNMRSFIWIINSKSIYYCIRQIYFYLLILFFGLCYSDCGTKKTAYMTTKSDSKTNDANVVDTAKYKCTYELKFLKDTIKMVYDDDLNVVQIGENFTKNYFYQTFYQDSMTNDGQKINFNLIELSDAISSQNTAYLKKHTLGFFSFYIYKDYRKEQMTVTDRISFHRFTYNDELKPQDWIIMEDTTTIWGYSCQKAICNFRGRDWEAWFTPDIPISEGPYKFYGLPGLIMKLEDTESHYSFIISDFQEVNEPIHIYIKNYFRTTDRLSFLKLKMNRTGIDLVAIESAKIGIDAPSYIQFDHIERDYK